MTPKVACIPARFARLPGEPLRKGGNIGRSAFSLIEANIAIALLAACFFLLFPLFHYALQYSTRVEQTALATTIARSRLADVRDWCRRKVSGGYNWDNPSGYPGLGPAADAEHPEFTVAVIFTNQTLYSPCTTFQSVQSNDALRRKLTSSCRRVEVRVSWTAAGLASQVALFSLVADPTRSLASLVVTGSAPGQVPADGTVPFTAQALDEDGRQIRDLFFHWNVHPRTGVGRVDAVSPDTVTCLFKNLSYRRDGTAQHTGGFCAVRARATYRGQVRSTTSSFLDLAP